MTAPGTDLEAIGTDDDGPPDDGATIRRRWLAPVLALCAVVATVSVAVIAVAQWRQADYAAEQACLSRAYTSAELDNSGENGEVMRAQQREQIAECFGIEQETARVPNVVGMTLREARTRVRVAGFVPRLETGDPEDLDEVVVAQEPPARANVARGSVVGLRTDR